MPKGSSTQTITETTTTKTGKVEKGTKRHQKKRKEAEKKTKLYFRIFAGKSADKLKHRNGITQFDKNANQFVDASTTVFIRELVDAALIARGADKKPTLMPEHVLQALRLNSNIDLITALKKRQHKKAKEDKE